ncbi:uncharacterized protein ATNIH1004_010472 [Aspergillus tanneri]|uniref:Uncharacterized protein n=1 Tax=Aspergillus tanneri TaxID=1220188 RepID=A0A5M9M9Y7_9EURO|nr:uncharacterized protein ATNIH1004_010472 [Aspergillus tanneri]KAA8643698.1 hypothetical protein ATNIH1004_010472 [Aspergillus tanneri]
MALALATPTNATQPVNIVILLQPSRHPCLRYLREVGNTFFAASSNTNKSPHIAAQARRRAGRQRHGSTDPGLSWSLRVAGACASLPTKLGKTVGTSTTANTQKDTARAHKARVDLHEALPAAQLGAYKIRPDLSAMDTTACPAGTDAVVQHVLSHATGMQICGQRHCGKTAEQLIIGVTFMLQTRLLGQFRSANDTVPTPHNP